MMLQFYPLFIFFFGLYPTYCHPLSEDRLPFDSNPDYSLALEAIFGMGLRLQVLQENTTTKNFVVSPLSTTMVVAQLMLGAEGKFRDDLYDLLSLPKSSSANLTFKKNNTKLWLPHADFHFQLALLTKALQKKRGDEKFKLKQSNALFYNQNIELQNNFTFFLDKFYGTEIKALDFYNDTRSTINEWASTHTNGLIKNMIKTNLPPDTSSVFMNAIYFLGEWRTPFANELNQVDEFFVAENRTVNTTYMMGTLEDIKFIETKDYRIIRIPYKNDELGMYILYPNKNNENKYDIKKFSEEREPADVLHSLKEMEYRNVVLKIPKLSLSNTVSILEPLRKYAAFKKVESETKKNTSNIDENLNVIDILKDKIDSYNNFTAPSDTDIYLTAATRNDPLRVSNIVQHMVFSINEKGTEAAAVTAGITDYMGGWKTVVLNRPFSFFVRHEATLATLFWGTISDPSSR